jgi:glycosyltransferase involved in cell wall biosynthesis
MSQPTLVLLPGLRAKKVSDRQIIITQKFLEGVMEYQKYWLGRIVVLLEEDPHLNDNLDHVLVDVNELPYQIETVNFDLIHDRPELSPGSVVIASEGYRQNHISKICQSRNVPCIYVVEYSLKTRMQIVNVMTKNPILKLRKLVWEISQELKQRKAIALAEGVQCNGAPTYEAYQSINLNPFLYFDTRITESMVVTDAELTARTAQCLTNAPLRLVFSGRLITIKGADHLILVAQTLKKLGVQFEMSICGDGDLKASMTQQIQAAGLTNSVKTLGVLEFKTELVPFVKQNADLFVCCHRQGDPACTYLETMSCGVPIVGYNNEAFAGVVQHSKAGWVVNINRPDLLAQKIAELDKNRSRIVAESLKSLEFAKLHTFEKTFERRIEHINKIALAGKTLKVLDSFPKKIASDSEAMKGFSQASELIQEAQVDGYIR